MRDEDTEDDQTLAHFPFTLELHLLPPPIVLHSNSTEQYKTDKQEVGVYLLTRALNLGKPSVLAISFHHASYASTASGATSAPWPLLKPISGI